jgi:cell wall assembly regulator SMI1
MVQSAFEVAEALSGLGDRVAAWRFIRDFAVAWATPISDGDGVSDEELAAAEARLGVRLPVAVREAYRLFGRRTDLTSVNGELWRPDELDYDRDSSVLIFRAAHQRVAYFGVSVADPALEDPPTVMYQTLLDKTQEAWVPFIARFSLACVDMVLWERVEAGEHADGRDQLDGEPASLVQGLTRLPFPRYPGDLDTCRWYARDDILLRDDDGAWVAICARTREALEMFRTRHPGRWVNAWPSPARDVR